MRALDRKLARDLWRMRGQVMAIAVVLAAAVATFVLSLSVHDSLTRTRDIYYARAAYAEVFADLTRAPRSVVARAAAIPGVRRAEGAIRQYATLDMAGSRAPVRAVINSLDEHGRDQLNRLSLRSGRLPQPGEPGEVVVDEAFARANGLGPGDSVVAQIYGTRQELRIVGVGLAPNYIYALAPGVLVPDDRLFGIFWIGEKALEAATDRVEAVNSLSLTLERGAVRADVIRALDTMLEPYGGTGAYGREDHVSHAFLDNELMQLEALTKVIPPVFLLVASFLVYVVLGRMIRTERPQIGLLKAFGYSDAAVGWHYTKLALAVAALASILGLAAGAWMGRSMTGLYAEYFRFPFLYYRLDPQVAVGAVALALAAAVLGALGGTGEAVRINPAVAMLPPPPPSYSGGLAERLGHRGGFTAVGNMIVRHVARWPARSAITVLGVGLSIGLLFATMQFLDSSRSMLDTYFFRAQKQDLTVTFTEPRNEAAVLELARLPGVLRAEPVRVVAVRISHANRVERTSIESGPASNVLTARIDAGGREVALPGSGLMLSSQLARQIAVGAGDQVLVELLGGRRTSLFLPVSAVVDEYVGAQAYAGETTLARLTRDAAQVGAVQLRIDPLARDDILDRLGTMPLVLGVTERDAALEKFEELIDENIFTMLALYIAFASAIAIGVVYNSARILFSERAHELATLRVLGYFRNEVGLVLVGELALLVLAAVPVGCLIGYWLAQLMTAMFSSDLFRLPFDPLRASYGRAVVIVLVAAAATAVVVSRRVMHLDMVRVLKARE